MVRDAALPGPGHVGSCRPLLSTAWNSNVQNQVPAQLYLIMYASRRMGTHPSGPAVIHGTNTTLKQWIAQHPEALGEVVHKRFGDDLPYLFKVHSLL